MSNPVQGLYGTEEKTMNNQTSITPITASEPLTQNKSTHDVLAHNLTGKILRPAKQAILLDISRATLYRLAKLPDFPKNVRLGTNSVGRFDHELLAWANSRKEG
jgi:predicted DNA-binding transcriptional regulator AlpA